MKTLLMVLVITMSGCATICGGSTEAIKVESEPSGEVITIDGGTYTTPAVVELSRKESHTVTFSDGEVVLVDGQFAPLSLLNIVWFPGGMVVGFIVDGVSGGLTGNLEPDHLIHKRSEEHTSELQSR